MGMREKDFAVFILTHGRPNNVVTYDALRKSGYTGRVIFLVDDEDKEIKNYQKKFGAEDVISFSKEEVAKRIDLGTNSGGRAAIVFARHAVYDVARSLGLKYFLQLDDDYTYFRYEVDKYGEGEIARILDMNRVLDIMLEYYKSIPALTIAMAQGGDFQQGRLEQVRSKRKAMNSFLCATDRPINFFGLMNEDVSTYVELGRRGELFLTTFQLHLNQLATQQTAGGMSGTYRDSGTYVKSFYSVMYTPSAVKIGWIGRLHKRVHHSVSWNNAVPKIIREEWKKR